MFSKRSSYCVSVTKYQLNIWTPEIVERESDKKNKSRVVEYVNNQSKKGRVNRLLVTIVPSITNLLE